MNPIKRQTEISGNLVLFCRFLRQKGYSLGMVEETDALHALEQLPFDSEQAFIHALRAVLAKSRLQHLKFEDHYREFWEQLERALNAKLKDRPEKRPSEAQKRKAQFEALKSWLNLMPAEEEKEIAAASPVEVLHKKHFSNLSSEEMKLMMRLLQKAARRLVRQKSRLKKASRLQKTLDLRRTIRHNLRQHGSEIQQMLFSKPKEKRLKLVLLCDVSKSMDLYSRFFIHLIYAFQNAYDRIETFVFSTALHRVSDLFEAHDLAKAYDIISERVPQWSGGTTIGQCFQKFASEYGHSLLDKKTVVLILSDGWDTGKPEIMRDAMRQIRRASRKIIWLNPLAGNPDFSPEVLGMKNALPYVDVLESAHNLESLKNALRQIGRKSRGKILRPVNVP